MKTIVLTAVAVLISLSTMGCKSNCSKYKDCCASVAAGLPAAYQQAALDSCNSAADNGTSDACKAGLDAAQAAGYCK